MSMTFPELETLRTRLEKVAPGIQGWDNAGKLYGIVADTVPEAALPAFVANLDLDRPEAPRILPILIPLLDGLTLSDVVYRASRSGNSKVLEACWDHVHQSIQERVLHGAARKRDTRLLGWCLGRGEFSQEALEEALMNSVWQGGRTCTDLLLGLVEKPWRVLGELRKKGTPDRLLRRLDEAWATAINEERAVVPDGRVLTSKFQADMPEVFYLAQAHRMEKSIPQPKTGRPRSWGRM